MTAPVLARSKKGKVLKQGKKGTTTASPTNPVSIKAWVWKPFDAVYRNRREEQKQEAAPREPFGAAVGVGEDWSHLNGRRQDSRQEKIKRDLGIMREVRAQQKQAARTS